MSKSVLSKAVAQRTNGEERLVWIDAGVIDENDNLDRYIPAHFWNATDLVQLDSEKRRLILSLMPGKVWPPSRVVHRVGPGRGMLETFLNLAEAPPEAILNYARAWGMFFVCQRHDLPCTHNPPPFTVRSIVASDSSDWCVPQWSNEEGFWESIETWRGLSRLMRALLNIGSYLHLERQPRENDWRTVFQERGGGLVILLNELQIENWEFAKDYPDMSQESSEIQCCVLERVLNLMLEWGDVRPTFQLINATSSIKMGSKGLFGALVVQLVLAINRIDGFAICTACNEPYRPKRRPRIDQRNYCSKPECTKARSRTTSRDSRKH